MPRKVELHRRKNQERKGRKGEEERLINEVTSPVVLETEANNAANPSSLQNVDVQPSTSVSNEGKWYSQTVDHHDFFWKMCFSVSTMANDPSLIPCTVQGLLAVHTVNKTWRLWVNGSEINKNTCKALGSICAKLERVEEVREALSYIDRCSICPGNTKKEYLDYASSVKALQNFVDKASHTPTVRHTICEGILGGKQKKCKPCNSLQERLRVRINRSKRSISLARRLKYTANTYLNTPQKMKKLTKLSRTTKNMQQAANRLQKLQ